MKQNKMKVIMVNGTNPNADEVMAQIKETGCNNVIFTGIGLTKAKKLVISMLAGTGINIRYKCFRKLDNASEGWVNDNFNVVSTIGDFTKGKGKKKAVKAESNISKEEAKDRAERFCNFLRNVGSDIHIYGYSFFKDNAEEYGATKTMRRGTKYYAYFGNMYVRY